MRRVTTSLTILVALLLGCCGDKTATSPQAQLGLYLNAVIQNDPQGFCKSIAGMYVYQADNSNSPWDLDFAASVGLLAHKTLITTPDCPTVAKAYINLIRNNKIVSGSKIPKALKSQQALVDLQKALKGPQEKPVLMNSRLQTIRRTGQRFTLFLYQGKWGVVPDGINSAKLLVMLDCSNHSMPDNQLSMLCS